MESNETNRFLEIDDNENDNYNIKDNISEKSKNQNNLKYQSIQKIHTKP